MLKDRLSLGISKTLKQYIAANNITFLQSVISF